MSGTDTAVLLIVFNRPQQTRRVLESVGKARPSRLYVAADGPRETSATDRQRCAEVLGLFESLDWPCETRILERSTNLGCKLAVSSAIDWFLSAEGEGIILEDDTVPHESFFPFCRELLEKYRSDDRIGMISGNNRCETKGAVNSYHFSRHGLIWGWATWRRAWQAMDLSMASWPEVKESGALHDVLRDPNVRAFWYECFSLAFEGKVDTWDYQWSYARYLNGLLTVRPDVNLVSNIGFGKDATHTVGRGRKSFERTGKATFPLSHPERVVPDVRADSLLERDWLRQNNLLVRSLRWCRAHIRPRIDKESTSQ